VEPVSDTVPLEIRVSATEMLLQLYSELSVLEPGAGVDVTCDTISRCLLRLAPAGLVVFYRHDDAADEVVTAYASGFGEALVRDVRMPLGHGVSGWVAANGRSVINADSALDLGHRMDGLEPRFRSVLSIPLTQPHGTVGVVTLYASQAHAFREEQRLAIEYIGGHMAEAFARALRTSPAPVPVHAPFLGSSHGHALQALLDKDRGPAGEYSRSLGVLCIKNLGDASLMAHATMAVNQATRIADLIFRPTDDSLVVLMPDSDAGAGQMVVDRIAAAMPPDVVRPPSESSPLRVGFACSPHDGDSVCQLLDAAQRRFGECPVAAFAPASPASLAPIRANGGQPCQA
jgi:putative methionine-R-sulfoxide reductase with GAF domain